MPDRTCSTCRFYDPIEGGRPGSVKPEAITKGIPHPDDYERVPGGFCRFDPPRPPIGYWPQVAAVDWCGQWAEERSSALLCAIKECPFPGVVGGYCRQHIIPGSA